jgi:hypothetical protein
LPSKYFVLAIEVLRSCYRNASFLLSQCFVLAIAMLRSCCRNISRLVAPLNYRVGDDRPEMA